MPRSQYAQPFRFKKVEIISEHFLHVVGQSVWYPDLQFLPGQYLLMDGEINGEYQRRSYSPYRMDTGLLGLTIKRNLGGIFSSELEQKKDGDMMRINAPTGKEKRFPKTSSSVIVLAFESGISFVKNLTTWGVENITSVFWLDEQVSAQEKKRVLSFLNIQTPVFCFENMSGFWQTFLKMVKPESCIYLSGNGQHIYFADYVLKYLQIPDTQIHREIYFHPLMDFPDEWKKFII